MPAVDRPKPVLEPPVLITVRETVTDDPPAEPRVGDRSIDCCSALCTIRSTYPRRPF